MIDVEPLIAEGLERLVPPPSGERADWQDVLARSGIRADGTRRVALAIAGFAAAAVLLVATPVGAAIAQGISDFSTWLTGHPGKQATASAQRAFEAANGRSWASFPTGTQLRELIRANVGGKQYVLSGFRSGNSLCLQIIGPQKRDSREPACAPASTLAHVSAPLLVVTGNGGFSDQYSHESAQFSFGIVADGVKRVDVHAVDGTHRALVGGNSYLWIEGEPNTGNVVKSISATDANDRTTTLAVGTSRISFGLRPSGKPGGPARVQATIRHPTIGWFVRKERRGSTPDEAHLTARERQGFAYCCESVRLFKPDPLSNIVVGLANSSKGWCMVIVNAGSGCGDERHFFSQGPVNFQMFGGGFNSSGEFIGLAGAAADGVKRITIFLGDGEQQSAPIKDNMFTALVPGRLPMRIVAYDPARRVVGIQQFPRPSFFAHLSVPSAARRNLHVVLHVAGPNGTAATVSVGRIVNRTRCWRIDYSTGQSESDCDSTFYTGPKITVNFVQPAGRDLFDVGGVDNRVTAHVELHFDNGDVITARPVSDRFVFVIPRAHMSTHRQFAYVVAIDRHGHRVQRQGIAFRSNP